MAAALDVEIRRLDGPARRQVRQVFHEVMPRFEIEPKRAKPAGAMAVPWNHRGSLPLSRNDPFSPDIGDDVTRTLAASHHRTVTVPNLPDLPPNDPTGPRFLVEDAYPSIDAARYPLKRIAGDPIALWADLLRDGPSTTSAELLWRT